MLITDVPDKSQPTGASGTNPSASPPNQLTSQLNFASVAITATGGGLKENLQGFSRISGISVLITLTCFFLGLCTYALIMVELSDLEWMNILEGKLPFPNLSPSATHGTGSYFEAKFIKDTPVGLMLQSRERWTPSGLDFGLARETLFHFILAGVVFAFGVVGVIHLFCICTYERPRRQFAGISIGYGALGLFMFLMFLANLHYGIVHKTSAYLENARVPPKVPPGGDNETRKLFINLTLACAFAYSTPNRFVNYTYPISELPLDGSFVVDGMKYGRDDLMNLNLCPRQDQFLTALTFLFITGFLGWLVSAVTETTENQILGPPAWLHRFKVETDKGVRHWKTRSALPSYLDLHNKLRRENTLQMKKLVEEELEAHKYKKEDAYIILEGKQEHVQSGVGKDWSSFSRHRFYPSNTNLAFLTDK